MRKTRLWPLVACMLLLSGPAAGQPLFLGDTEIDASDEATMGSVLDRCTDLAATAPDADRVRAFTQATSSVGEEGGQPDPYLVLERDAEGEFVPAPEPLREVDEVTEGSAGETPLSLEAPDGGEGGGAAAGEGAGQGPIEATGDDPEPGDEQAQDLSEITLEDCKQAGLVY